jgi:hypothetical protein
MRSRRLRYLALTVGTIAVGLAVHLRGAILPSALRDILGDALWASMVVWLTGVALPRERLWVRGLIALAVSYAVEFSQMYHSPAVDAVRDTTIGRLTLGSDFDPRDLAAYSAGVLAAMLLDMRLTRSNP